jgi:hypothetical protein
MPHDPIVLDLLLLIALVSWTEMYWIRPRIRLPLPRQGQGRRKGFWPPALGPCRPCYNFNFHFPISKMRDIKLTINSFSLFVLALWMSNIGALLTRLDGRGIEVRLPTGTRVFFTSFSASRRTLGSTHIQRVPRAFSTGRKWPKREADHVLPFSAEIKNGWIYTPLPICSYSIMLK